MFLGASVGKNMNYPSDWLSRETICDVFVRMKPRFLVYAPFVEMCNNVDKMIELMKCDPNVLEDVENFENRMMEEMEEDDMEGQGEETKEAAKEETNVISLDQMMDVMEED